MVAFPLIENLIVEDYGLYPGKDRRGSLKLSLSSGPWIILGVNGLGKSTLLLLLKHLLSGPRKSVAAGFRGDRAETMSVNPRLFAMRVADEAVEAKGKLTCSFGKTRLTVTRRLSDLSLISAHIEQGGRSESVEEEGLYLQKLADAMGLPRYEDAIRVIDRIVFILEEEAPLIWDVAAQYEIFRALLRPAIAGELRSLEAQIVSADSSARNLNAVITRVERRRDNEVLKERGSGDTRAQLAAATAELEIAQAEERRAQQELEDADQGRVDARIELKRAEHAVDHASQEYEAANTCCCRRRLMGCGSMSNTFF